MLSSDFASLHDGPARRDRTIANNFYAGLSMADLKGFHDAHPLNSRAVKQNGKIVEEIGLDDGVTALQQLGLIRAV